MKKFYSILTAGLCLCGSAYAAPYNAASHAGEPEGYAVVGDYTLTIRPTNMMCQLDQPVTTMNVEVRNLDNDYWFVEIGETDFLKGYSVPFSYNASAGLAIFDQTYVGTTDDPAFSSNPYLWMAAFIDSGFTEPQPKYSVSFSVDNGFGFAEANEAGIALFGSDKQTAFNPYETFVALFIYGSSKMEQEADYGNPDIEGSWKFILNGKYLGNESLGEFSETFEAVLEGNTVTFLSPGSPYNIVARFVAENTLEFSQCAVGTPATYTLYQSPFVNTSAVEDMEDLEEKVFTAVFNPAEGTISFPEGSGLRYGYFSNGVVSSWIDAFDFVSASKAANEIIGSYTWFVVPTDTSGEKNADVDEISVEVRKNGNKYAVYELGNTNYFNNFAIPFTYNDMSGLVQFTATYAGTIDENPIWISAFVYNEDQSSIELQENFGTMFSPDSGFSFPGTTGFAWVVTSSADEFDAESVYSAFYVVPSADSAVETVISESEGDALYFDLQGRVVRNPASGIYIKKCGDKVQKIIVR